MPAIPRNRLRKGADQHCAFQTSSFRLQQHRQHRQHRRRCRHPHKGYPRFKPRLDWHLLSMSLLLILTPMRISRLHAGATVATGPFLIHDPWRPRADDPSILDASAPPSACGRINTMRSYTLHCPRTLLTKLAWSSMQDSAVCRCGSLPIITYSDCTLACDALCMPRPPSHSCGIDLRATVAAFARGFSRVFSQSFSIRRRG